MESLSKSVYQRRTEHMVPKYTFSRLLSQELVEEWLNTEIVIGRKNLYEAIWTRKLV